SPLVTSTGEDGAWIEEYADFRVTLRHTEWSNGENSGTIEAKTPEAAVALANAVRQVTGQQVR
ncbi:MAG TPA: hypothetical protein VNG35_02505, partial [Gemmatimonadales bacterium]|nr:hypothetical protein [Gemmatimonadales bacterium]